ncbi:MAG TPA: conjugal transfer protein TraF, partial [bacterium]|nr:conjugal transfer protein TraF [bacterium]
DEEFEAEDIKDDFDKTKKETTTFGVDLGLMYSLTDAGKTKIGLVVKNINTPKFDQPDSAIIAGYGKEIELKPQARLGVSFHPWKRVFVTADYDVTKNKTIMKNYKSQIFAAGLELNLLKQEQKNFNIALRGGYKSNLAEKDEGAILTAGIGFGLLHCQLDISGNMSTKKVQNEDGDKIPQAAGVMATLSLNF